MYPNDFTRHGQNANHVQPSIIDILLTNSSMYISPLETHFGALNSDHVPITCHILGSAVEHEHTFLQYNRANWKAIKKWVDAQLKTQNIATAVVTSLNVENILGVITKIVQEATQQIPVKETNYEEYYKEVQTIQKELQSSAF
ncbi:uncharacterized protein LOC142229041 [Haematobia irritans]|uniref:uncharacterized protein LOC142229041 n=1 Tax=Haematobia irritans TaxID=7368 RepID=UPI003F4F4EC4